MPLGTAASASHSDLAMPAAPVRWGTPPGESHSAVRLLRRSSGPASGTPPRWRSKDLSGLADLASTAPRTPRAMNVGSSTCGPLAASTRPSTSATTKRCMKGCWTWTRRARASRSESWMRSSVRKLARARRLSVWPLKTSSSWPATSWAMLSWFWWERRRPSDKSLQNLMAAAARSGSKTASTSTASFVRIVRRMSEPARGPLASIAQTLAYNACMPRGFSIDLSTSILIALAVLATGIAHWKDPGLPLLGARNGLSMVWFILPRLIPALILAGMLQVIIPQESIARYFGQQSGIGAILMASAAGVLTPGGPMVSVPLLVVLANSGMALGPLVAYMTSWSLFGMQRIIAWEAPLMGWRFVLVRIVPSLAFPVIAGWLVKLYYNE